MENLAQRIIFAISSNHVRMTVHASHQQVAMNANVHLDGKERIALIMSILVMVSRIIIFKKLSYSRWTDAMSERR